MLIFSQVSNRFEKKITSVLIYKKFGQSNPSKMHFQLAVKNVYKFEIGLKKFTSVLIYKKFGQSNASKMHFQLAVKNVYKFEVMSYIHCPSIYVNPSTHCNIHTS